MLRAGVFDLNYEFTSALFSPYLFATPTSLYSPKCDSLLFTVSGSMDALQQYGSIGRLTTGSLKSLQNLCVLVGPDMWIGQSMFIFF